MKEQMYGTCVPMKINIHENLGPKLINTWLNFYKTYDKMIDSKVDFKSKERFQNKHVAKYTCSIVWFRLIRCVITLCCYTSDRPYSWATSLILSSGTSATTSLSTNTDVDSYSPSYKLRGRILKKKKDARKWNKESQRRNEKNHLIWFVWHHIICVASYSAFSQGCSFSCISSSWHR